MGLERKVDQEFVGKQLGWAIEIYDEKSWGYNEKQI